MNLLQKAKVKKLISQLSSDPNYTLPLKEQAYYQALLLKEGIELSLILTLLKMGEITFPKSFNFSLSPDFIEREKLKVKVNPNQNYFAVLKQLGISISTENEVKDMETLNKMDNKKKGKGLNPDEQSFEDEVKDANPNLNITRKPIGEDLKEEDELNDNEIMENQRKGVRDPLWHRIHHEKKSRLGMDKPNPDSDENEQNEEQMPIEQDANDDYNQDSDDDSGVI